MIKTLFCLTLVVLSGAVAVGCQSRRKVADQHAGIDKNEIRQIIVGQKDEIRNCYEQALKKSPDLYGKLVLQWDIEDGGRVTQTKVKSDTMNSPQSSEVASCILERIKLTTFPAPPKNQIGRVTFPFVFKSENPKKSL